MWFKNLLIYQLRPDFKLPEGLDKQLADQVFLPCGKTDLERLGWVSPAGDEHLSIECAGLVVLRARKQRKLLPAAAINELLEDRVKALELRESRQIFRKERLQLKEEILLELAPRALTRSSHIDLLIDPKNGWLLADSSNRNQTEEVLNLLREGLGSLPLMPLTGKLPTPTLLTRWLKEANPPAHFSFADSAVLRAEDAPGNVVRVKEQALLGEEVHTLLEAGKQVIELALVWEDQVQFVLREDLSVRRLRFSDPLLEQSQNLDDRRAQMVQDLGLMGAQLRQLLPALATAFSVAPMATPA